MKEAPLKSLKLRLVRKLLLGENPQEDEKTGSAKLSEKNRVSLFLPAFVSSCELSFSDGN
jgi:hypothetical protein